MRSTYKTARDILNMIRRFHQQLSEFYEQLSEISEKKRVRMLLEYMSRHEKNFEQALAEYDHENASKVLDAWIQYAPDSDILSIPKAKNLHSDISVDDVVDIAMELDDHLIKFYSEAERCVDFSVLKDFFGRLKEQEQADEAELVRSAEDIKHYI
jgi:rubrerythrin